MGGFSIPGVNLDSVKDVLNTHKVKATPEPEATGAHCSPDDRINFTSPKGQPIATDQQEAITKVLQNAGVCAAEVDATHVVHNARGKGAAQSR